METVKTDEMLACFKAQPNCLVEWLRKTTDTNKKSQGIFNVLAGGSVNGGLLQRVSDHKLWVLLGMDSLPSMSSVSFDRSIASSKDSGVAVLPISISSILSYS